MNTGSSNIDPSRHSRHIATNGRQPGPSAQGFMASFFGTRSVTSSPGCAVQNREALLGDSCHEYRPGQSGYGLRHPGRTMSIPLDNVATAASSRIEAETSTTQTGGSRFNTNKYENDWLDGPEPNSVVVSRGTGFPSPYVCLTGREGFIHTVKVSYRNDVEPQTAYLTMPMRQNCKLKSSDTLGINITKGAVAKDCWDSVALDIHTMQAASSGQTRGKKASVTKSWHAISDAFLRMCHQSGCPLEDSHSYIFTDGDHRFVARVKLRSSGGDQESTAGLLTSDARVTRIDVSDTLKKQLDIVDVPAAIDIKKLAIKFDYNGEAYGIGGANEAIRQFVDSFISPRLVPEKLQNTMKCHLTRGGILSGPPGTGKTLFIRVIESLLKENGFTVSTKIISGPEVFNRYAGESEKSVRAIFSDEGLENKQSLRLVLIDEIDSMLPVRGRAGDSGIGDKVVNQFLTCMDGYDKPDNLIVFGTTNRPDLIDRAVLRPGRMDMKMIFNLPEADQRLEILKIQTRALSDSGMLNPDVSLAELAKNTAGFSGAELGALVEKARQSALRRGQGLTESDTFFRPQALRQLETLDVCMADFNWAFTQVEPQFGKSNFMSLEGKSFEYDGYSPDMVSKLRDTLVKFKQDDSCSTLRILIKGPQGSGKSTLAALANNEFGEFCSYVSATDVVKSRDRTKPLNDVFAERRNHQTNRDCHYVVIIDDFDTMINFNGDLYDRAMVSVLDAHTKQSLQGLKGGKLLIIVTATDHGNREAKFLPRLFSDSLVFKTMGKES